MSEQNTDPVNAAIAFAGQQINTGGAPLCSPLNGAAMGISGGCTKSAALNVGCIMVGSWLPFP
jgi:hypothetical protein